MKSFLLSVENAKPSKIISSFVLLLVLTGVSPALMNAIFRDNLFKGLFAQAVWLWMGSMLFLTAASINMSRLPLKADVDELKELARNLSTQHAAHFIKIAIIGVLFVLFIWATCDFKMLWPSPIPMTGSLFILSAIIFQRERVLGPWSGDLRTKARKIGEPIILLALYSAYLGLMRHQIDFSNEGVIIFLGSGYLITMACKD
jgi:hypothetical protein